MVSKQAADGPLGGGQAETSLLCREAYTTFAAEEVAERLAGFGLQRERATTSNPAASQVIDHLVHRDGLQLANGAERRSALHDTVFTDTVFTL